MANPKEHREGDPQRGRQAGGQDDRRPQDGNPGDDQIKNMPGQGARRSDQGSSDKRGKGSDRG